MTRCQHCGNPIQGEHVRLDAGQRIGTDLAFDILERDVNLHDPCYGPWMLAHYPWLVKVRTTDVTAPVA